MSQLNMDRIEKIVKNYVRYNNSAYHYMKFTDKYEYNANIAFSLLDEADREKTYLVHEILEEFGYELNLETLLWEENK